jgi:hypothetical protein
MWCLQARNSRRYYCNCTLTQHIQSKFRPGTASRHDGVCAGLLLPLHCRWRTARWRRCRAWRHASCPSLWPRDFRSMSTAISSSAATGATFGAERLVAVVSSDKVRAGRQQLQLHCRRFGSDMAGAGKLRSDWNVCLLTEVISQPTRLCACSSDSCSVRSIWLLVTLPVFLASQLECKLAIVQYWPECF